LEHERLNTKIGMKVRKELNERKFEWICRGRQVHNQGSWLKANFNQRLKSHRIISLPNRNGLLFLDLLMEDTSIYL
jgi:hypothetical protein